MNYSLNHYKEALKYIGTRETPGNRSNPLIQAWIKQSASWLNQDDSATPWCGCFRAHIGIACGTSVPHESFRAASWLRWGSVVRLDPSTWWQGDTVVLRRDGGHHVALLDHYANGSIWLLGGNQGDCVDISQYSLDRVVAVRR